MHRKSDSPQHLLTLQADFALVLNYLAITDPIVPTDVIFIFGGYHLVVPAKAAELYHLGVAPRLMVTGKDGSGTRPDPDWTLAIAEVFRQHLLALDVPDKAILIMPDSTNTLEDVQFGVPLLQEQIPDLATFTLVTRPVHQRRALATIRHAYPHYRYVCCPADEPVATIAENSPTSCEQIERALGELERLRRYAMKGDIEEQRIPENVEGAYQRLAEFVADSG